MVLATFVFASLLAVSHCSHSFSLSYRFSLQLNENYTLYWTFDNEAQNISFAVRVRTRGWVGFGLSPNGQMPRSDVVIGWVESGGRTRFDDRFALGRFTPPIDTEQNWFLIRGEEEDGFTALEFWRNFTSCDERDHNIGLETARVVWSYHSDDPTDPTIIPRHQMQGSTSVNLLGGLENSRTVPSDSASFTVSYDNVQVPGADTTYFCSFHSLIHLNITEEVYIYKVSPFITPGNTALVHHMLVYVCPNDTAIAPPGNCDSLPSQVVACRGGQVLASWAVGGTGFIFPEGVALPAGGPNNNPQVLLELHYDNPNRQTGLTDSSGLQFFYSKQPPTHMAGGLSLGYPITPDLVIPPGAVNFTVPAICSVTCLERFLPDDGITVFGSFLHSHLAGRGFVVQHTRTVGTTCDGAEELTPIDQNLQYDFDYQQSVILPRPIQIRKGDSIIVNCMYSSQDRNEVILGGESTRQEMCYVLLYYYPRMNLTTCQSIPEAQAAYGSFLTRALGDSNRAHSTVLAFYSSQSDTIKSSFNSISWNNDTIGDFQNAITSNQDYFEFCYTIESKPDQIHEKRRPNIDCPYVAPNTCSPSSAGPGMNGPTNDSVVTIAAASVAGVVGFIIVIAVISTITAVVCCCVKRRKQATKYRETDSELVTKSPVPE